MYWLKVGREFYNLDCVTKIDYSIEDSLIVNIYTDLSEKPYRLEGVQAALFLNTISHTEGCWAFQYPDDDVMKIQAVLDKSSFKSEEKSKAIKTFSSTKIKTDR